MYQAPLAKGENSDKETVRHEQGRKCRFFFQLSRGIAATVCIHQNSSTIANIAILFAFGMRRNSLIFSRRTRQRHCFDPSIRKLLSSICRHGGGRSMMHYEQYVGVAHFASISSAYVVLRIVMPSRCRKTGGKRLRQQVDN